MTKNKEGLRTLARTVALFFIALTLGFNLNAQAHIDMQMVFVGSTATTADFDVVLTNDGTTALNFNAIVIRANNATVSTITTAGSTVTAIALNNNSIPAWTISGNTWPNITGNMPYNQTGTLFKLNQSTNSTFFTQAQRPTLPTNVPVNIGRFRFIVTGGTWVPNSQLGFVWYSNAGVVCDSDGTLTSFNTTTNRTMGASANQPLNVPASGTQIVAGDCGTTVASAISFFHATPVVGAEEYEFRIYNGVTYHTFNSGLAAEARFHDFGTGNYMYNTTYSVDVRVKVAGVWSSYGTACNISTPNAPLTGLVSSQCGTTLLMNQYLSGQHVFGANSYRFRVSDGVTTQIFDTTVYWINSNHFALLPATSYSVDIAPGINGTYYAYGPVCSITTANTPTSRLSPSQCGTTLVSTTQNLNGTWTSGATSYRFRIYDGVTYQTFNSPNYWTSISNFTTTLGTTYTVDVAPTVGGVLYPYGVSCSITTMTAPTSRLSPSQCGATFTTNTQNLNGTWTSGATSYRFRIYDGVTYQTFDSPNYWTSISNFTVSFATTYTVDVAPTVGGTLYPYGVACSITTMTAPTSRLNPSQCGTTLITSNQNLIGTWTSGATSYRFRLYDGVTYQTFDSPNYWTSISNFTTTFATTYTVDVAPTVGGIVYPYGVSCSITTMTFVTPTSRIVASQCGTTLSTMTSFLSGTWTSGGTSYRFRIYDGVTYQTFDSPNYWTSMSNFTVTAATTYTVDIAPTVGGTMYPYGVACSVTTPGVATIAANDKPGIEYTDKALDQGAFTFETKMYPNPFSNMFNVELTSDDTNTPVAINVYDATGRMIESREVKLNNETIIDLGLDYAPGVYQVHVIQNNYAKTSRIVKR